MDVESKKKFKFDTYWAIHLAINQSVIKIGPSKYRYVKFLIKGKTITFFGNGP
jgi:hypothetical protein